MRFEFKLPDLAEGMVEGEIVSWLVGVGDAVVEEQPMVEVMTDKATVVISSPRVGAVKELSYEAGDIAEVGTTLFVLDVEGQPGEVEAAPAASEAAPAPAASSAPAPAAAAPAAAAPAVAPPAAVAPTPRGPSKALATPATRRIARELGVDIGQVPGSGPHGRVTKQDVQAFAAGGAPTPAASAPAATPAAPAYQYKSPAAQDETEERVKVRGLRRAIADTMARSTRTAAHFTYVEEIDCTNLVAARKRLKPAAEAVGVRMNYLPFIAKACLLALRAFPKMNATMDDAAGEIVFKNYRHLGIAAATDAGLTVPVIRHADHMTLMDLAAAIADLGARARSNKLKPTEVKGSTFTITSLGKTGGLFATPVINHPEVAILGVHKMEPRAVIRDGQIVARQMMNISLSFDHRVIDGHEGADFAQRVKRYLEDPELMMLEMA